MSDYAVHAAVYYFLGMVLVVVLLRHAYQDGISDREFRDNAIIIIGLFFIGPFFWIFAVAGLLFEQFIKRIINYGR